MKKRRRGRVLDPEQVFDVFGVRVQLSRTLPEKTFNIHVLNPEVVEVLTDRQLAGFGFYVRNMGDVFGKRYPGWRVRVTCRPPNYAR